MASPVVSESDKKFQIENDVRTLREAEEIKNDPARLKAAKKMAKEQIAELKTVTGNPDHKDGQFTHK